ncbi:MAG: SPOR domain-containing protein [Rickettsiales bacterium]|nr:SPOR domain-containing protein [Rickettsiales bacterium]
MKKIFKKQNISYLIFGVFFTAFILLLIKARDYQYREINKISPLFIYANNEKIRVKAKNKNQDIYATEQKIYDFVNKKDWKLETNKVQKKEKNNIPVKILKTKKTEPKTKPKIISYKNHVIKIKEKSNNLKNNKLIKNYVQLGAYKSYEKAESEKENISKIINNRQKILLHIEKAHLEKKGIIYRLKAGPHNNSAEAKNFCDNLRKKAIECFLKTN